jgi:ferrous iron transport protein A
MRRVHDENTTIAALRPNVRATVVNVEGQSAIRRRIIDMGITPGAVVFVRKASPLGDPIQINVRGYELCLRKAEAEQITVKTDVNADKKVV